jgi:uncharacterized protein YggE
MGTANIEFPADQINWTVDIRKIADTFEESSTNCNSALNSLLEILNLNEIDKNHIQISPIQQGKYYEQDYDRRTRVFKGFVSSLIVNFILKDMMKYSELVSKLSKSDEFENIRSSYSDSKYEDHHKETLIKASDEAKKKAIYLIENIGKKIGSVLEVVETNSSYPNPFNSSTSLPYEMPINSGKVSYSRSVKIKFEITEK